MVSKQDFISGLLEPLEPAMAPLAMADAPGAVVRGLMSGQSLPGVLGSLDPLSMEGRVHGEDITGSPTSGLLVDMLTDPMMLAGMGTAGLGMALSRREFLKRTGRGAAAAAGGGEGLLKALIKAKPAKPTKTSATFYPGGYSVRRAHRSVQRAWLFRWNELDRLLAQAEDRMYINLEDALAEHGPKALRSSEYWGREQVKLMEEMKEVEANLAQHGYELSDIDDMNIGLTDDQGSAVFGQFKLKHEGLAYADEDALARKAEVIDDYDGEIAMFKEGLREEWRDISKRLTREANPQAQARHEAREEILSAGREPGIVPADMEILARLIREMSLNREIPGGRPRGY